MGFSTGEWQGRVLRVDTTHIKQGWHRRNGVPMSAQTTMTEYFFRHGNVLTQLSITEDPCSCPSRWSRPPTCCWTSTASPNRYQAWLFCQADDEVPGRDPAYVPHYLVGQEPVT